ncbi:MAG: hypothetical protein SNJ55_04995 [Chloroherpetonaceae bacterium]
MTDFSALNLKANPFEDITPAVATDSRRLVWAGAEGIKKNLEKAYRDFGNARLVVLNWGQWGGGKTFASYYFAQTQKDITHIYVRLPKDGATAIEQFFKDILDALDLDSVKSRVRTFQETVGNDDALNFLKQHLRSKEFAEAVLALGETDEAKSALISKYIFGTASKTELKKLGLSRAIESDTDYIRVLCGILLCFIGTNQSEQKLALWIDEMEDLLYFNSKQAVTFTQSLRDLIDTLSERFLCVMNFSLATNAEDDVKIFLRDALWSRINRKIHFPQLTLDEALRYCKDLLNAYQIHSGGYAPFEETALKAVLEKIPFVERLPRRINSDLSELLYFALEHDLDKIDVGVINDFFESSKIGL